MPQRPLNREQGWLLPPSLEELVPADHPARFVAAFVDALGRRDWGELGVAAEGSALGAPSYAPRVLLGVWLYGFMTGVRSSRKLEAACRDQVPYLWLTGWQRPDHNTLWRFYQANRAGMRKLFKRTVRTAVAAGLVELALQAVDGSKIGGNASRERTYDVAGLRKLLERAERAIADLEAQNAGGEEPAPPRLPERLRDKRGLRERVEAALAQVAASEDAEARINLSDPEAQLLKTRRGFVAGYNAQAMVAGLDPATAGRTGLLLTAAEVAPGVGDQEMLLPLRAAAVETTGQAPVVLLADGGFHSGENLAACAERGQVVVMAEAQQAALSSPYHKDAFGYDAAADTYTCPQGQPLAFRRVIERADTPAVRQYRAQGAACRACPLFGTCTKDRRGRSLEVGPQEGALRRHRQWMATAEAQALYRRRKTLPEPAFGLLKEHQDARRFLLRGLQRVRAEWSLLATTFNLRTLWRVWRQRPPAARRALVGLGL
jgi:transposase